MPSGIVSGVDQGMSVLDAVVIVEGDRERGSFGGEFGATHCNQGRLCDAALPILLRAGLVNNC